jgi:hypothetical protein
VRRLVLSVLVVTAAVAGVAAVDVTAAGQSTTTISLISGNARESVTDKAPKELARGVASRGDVIRGASVLRNAVRQFGKPSGAIVGRDSYSFTFVSPTEAVIAVKVVLPGGTLTARGRMRVSQGDRIAVTVTGGTGKFAGARGTGEARALSPNESLNVYRLRFPETA